MDVNTLRSTHFYISNPVCWSMGPKQTNLMPVGCSVSRQVVHEATVNPSIMQLLPLINNRRRWTVGRYFLPIWSYKYMFIHTGVFHMIQGLCAVYGSIWAQELKAYWSINTPTMQQHPTQHRGRGLHTHTHSLHTCTHLLIQKVNAPNSPTFTTHTKQHSPPGLLSDEPSSRQCVWDLTP